MKKRSIIRQLLFYAVVLIVIVGMGSVLLNGVQTADDKTYDDILNYFYNEQVREVVISPKNVLTIKVVEDGAEKMLSYKLRDYSQFY